MRATDTVLSPGRQRLAQRTAIVLVAVSGLVAGAIVLAIEPVSDFLGEGAVRVLGLEGGSRRLLIGLGLIVTTVVAGGALTRGGRARYALAGAAVIVALFLAGPAALPLAGAAVVAAAVARASTLTRAQVGRAAPRRHPAAWAAGGVIGVIAVVAAGWIGWRLTAPLFDEGRELNETLAFAVGPAAPGGGATAVAPVSGSATASGAVADASAAGTLVAEGELMGVDSFHTGSGRVLLVRAPDGAAVLRFEGYEVRNGPDLRIYLTPDPDGDVFAAGAVDLGGIKATSGNVNYDVPAGADLESFRTAVVYCFGFRVTFATAMLR